MADMSRLPKIIILADDDEDDRMLFEEALLEIDHHSNLTTVSDGQELMDLLSAMDSKVDSLIIFIDLNMPKMNGFECLKEIMNKDHLRNIPVVVYSTSCEAEAIDEMYNHGASFYICKPNNFSKLKTSLEDVLNFHINNPVPKIDRNRFVIAY